VLATGLWLRMKARLETEPAITVVNT